MKLLRIIGWLFIILIILFTIFSPEFNEWLKKPYEVKNVHLIILLLFMFGRILDKN
jgi:hypothetical protein